MRYLGIDLGEKRIGLAVSDGLGMVAAAYGHIQRRSRREDFTRIEEIIRQEGIDHLVVGLPVLLSGEEGRMAAWARDYGTDLARHVNRPVAFWDEALTSEMAEESLRAQGLSKKKMKGKVDAVAAALILQSFLNAVRE